MSFDHHKYADHMFSNENSNEILIEFYLFILSYSNAILFFYKLF